MYMDIYPLQKCIWIYIQYTDIYGNPIYQETYTRMLIAVLFVIVNNGVASYDNNYPWWVIVLVKLSRTLWGPTGYKSPSVSPVSCL